MGEERTPAGDEVDEVDGGEAEAAALCLEWGAQVAPIRDLVIGHRDALMELGFSEEQAAEAAMVLHDSAVQVMFGTLVE